MTCLNQMDISDRRNIKTEVIKRIDEGGFSQEVNFNVKPFDKLTFNDEFITNNETNNLIRIVVTFGETPMNYSEYIEAFDKYEYLIDLAIKMNNLEALDILWKGIYVREDSPDFKRHLETAAKFSNVIMCRFVFHNYIINSVYNVYDEKGKRIEKKYELNYEILKLHSKK